MIVKKIGPSWMFIFPANEGRLKVSENPAGKISIGSTITVLYALKIIGGKARFIGVDGSTMSPELLAKINVVVESAQANKLFGFMVRDSKQPQLDIRINPSFMSDIEKNVGELQWKMAHQGNLNITLEGIEGGARIVSVILD